MCQRLHELLANLIVAVNRQTKLVENAHDGLLEGGRSDISAVQPCEETVRQYLNKFVRKEPAREKSQETLREERSEDDLNPCRRKVRRRRLLKDTVSLETLLRLSSSITQPLGNVKRYKPSQHTAGPRGFSHPKIN
ncbi:hypothetical protein Bbelb_446000 [Branchiostoma belcheri]|nr:hypothetical protein Bbelb_446000 [Branchiostoma belcheri]